MTALTALQRAQNLANTVAETEHDMNVAKVGGGAKLLPAGTAMARFVAYVELGQHIGEFGGKPKDYPELMVRFGFALWGKTASGETYHNEDGSPTIKYLPWEYSMSANSKAKTFKMFKKMNYNGTAKQFIGLIGEAYLLPIRVEPKKS